MEKEGYREALDMLREETEKILTEWETAVGA